MSEDMYILLFNVDFDKIIALLSVYFSDENGCIHMVAARKTWSCCVLHHRKPRRLHSQ